MTDKTRETIAEGNPYDEYEEAEYGRLPVGSLSDEHRAWNEGAAFTLALEVAGVPLSELIEKAESGKLADKGALLMRFAEWALTLEHDEWMIAAEDIDRMKAGLEPEGMWMAAKALKGECLLCDHTKAEGGDDYCEDCRLAINTEQQHEEDELTRHQGV